MRDAEYKLQLGNIIFHFWVSEAMHNFSRQYCTVLDVFLAWKFEAKRT